MPQLSARIQVLVMVGGQPALVTGVRLVSE
jgi:hypothetical protein